MKEMDFIKILIICCIPILVNSKNCKTLLSELADCQSKYLYCVATNSVPVTMCTGCKGQHDDVLTSYDKLYQSCNTTYFDKDRINLVSSTEILLTDLWVKAYCDDCFNNNNSITFNNKSTNFNDCLARNPVKPCYKCKNEYKELNDFYLSLDRHNDGEVCFDIQDSMNRTRNKWSKELNCCLREYNILYFSIAMGMTTFITLMFYCGTYLLTKHRERNHGILNNEDPSFNSSPSALEVGTHPNITNNQAQSNRLPPPNNEGINILPSTSGTCCDNKSFKEIEDSSDDEPLINPSMLKEKLK